MKETAVSNTGFNSPKEFILTLPLYKEFDLEIGVVAEEIYAYLQYSGTIDAYCIYCDKDSVFDTTDYLYSSLFDWKRSNDTDFIISYTCTRNGKHKYYIHFYKIGYYFTKIGQFPSIADFQIPQANKYRKILGENLYKEFTRGIGLAANGIGIGSFVYLRRIFENLVEEAHLLTLKEPGFSEIDYVKARMDEKIQILRHHLPEFLVENRKIYSILSTGIHDLTEEDCLKYFQSVKIGIEQILDEKIEKEEKKQKAIKAKELLKDVVQEVSSNGKINKP